MPILHRNGIPFFPTFDSSFVPSRCKDYFLEKVLCMYQGSGEESVLRLLSRALRTCYIKVSSVNITFAEEAIRGHILGENKNDRFSYQSSYKITVGSVSLC